MYLLAVNKWVTGFTCGNSHCGSSSELSSHQRDTNLTWPCWTPLLSSTLSSGIEADKRWEFPTFGWKNSIHIEVQLLCKVWYCIIKLVLDNSSQYCPIVNINALLQCEDTKPATAGHWPVLHSQIQPSSTQPDWNLIRKQVQVSL